MEKIGHGPHPIFISQDPLPGPGVHQEGGNTCHKPLLLPVIGELIKFVQQLLPFFEIGIQAFYLFAAPVEKESGQGRPQGFFIARGGNGFQDYFKDKCFGSLNKPRSVKKGYS